MVKVPKPVIEDIRMWLSFNNKDNLLSRLDACLEPDDRKLSDLVGRLRSRLSSGSF